MSGKQRRKNANLTEDFLYGWLNQRFSRYESEYGGQRTGTPKGDPIPFPQKKLLAAVWLIAYGAPGLETLTKVAKAAGVSPGVLRVWRTEDRFLELYRRVLWDLVDFWLVEAVKELSSASPHSSSALRFFRGLGVPSQQMILRRLAQITREHDSWRPVTSSRVMQSECELIGNPINPPPPLHVSKLNLYLLTMRLYEVHNDPGFDLKLRLKFGLNRQLLGITMIHTDLVQANKLLRKGHIKQALKQYRELTEGVEAVVDGIREIIDAASALGNKVYRRKK